MTRRAPPAPAVTADSVYARLLAADGLTLGGYPAILGGIADGKFIRVRSAAPVVPGVWAEAEYHYLTAARALDLHAGAFRL